MYDRVHRGFFNIYVQYHLPPCWYWHGVLGSPPTTSLSKEEVVVNTKKRVMAGTAATGRGFILNSVFLQLWIKKILFTQNVRVSKLNIILNLKSVFAIIF